MMSLHIFTYQGKTSHSYVCCVLLSCSKLLRDLRLNNWCVHTQLTCVCLLITSFSQADVIRTVVVLCFQGAVLTSHQGRQMKTNFPGSFTDFCADQQELSLTSKIIQTFTALDNLTRLDFT